MMRVRATRAILALGAALATGCLGRGSPTEFYTLSASTGRQEAPLGARAELGLVVGPIEFPRYLDRPGIVARDGSHRLVVSEEARWAGSLRDDILRVVADDLGARLGTARVAVYPVEPRFQPDYRVLLDIREFEGARGEAVVLRVRWTIASGSDGHALAVEESVVEQPVASAAWADYVAAQGAALGQVTRAIAARLSTLPKS